MSISGPVILGYQVRASVEGKKGALPISQRFTSQQAAIDFCELPKKNGFLDAYVTSVDGFEKNPNEAPKPRARTQPPKP